MDFLTFRGANLESLEGYSVNCPFDTRIYAAIATHCPNLRSYKADTRNMTPADLRAVLRGCPLLAELCFEGANLLGDAGMLEIAQLGARLTSLSVVDCQGITDQSMPHVLSTCRHLRKLKLRGTMFTDRLTYDTFSCIAWYCHQLTDLDLCNQCELGNVALAAIAAKCPLLRRLDISRSRVANKSLIPVLTNCRELDFLCVHDCKRVTEKGLRHIARLCPQMTELCIAGSKATVRGVRAIALSLRKLRYVEIGVDVVQLDPTLKDLFCRTALVVVV